MLGDLFAFPWVWVVPWILGIVGLCIEGGIRALCVLVWCHDDGVCLCLLLLPVGDYSGDRKVMVV